MDGRPEAEQVDVVVVGAGLAGLTAARDLAAAGLVVVVVDKGRRPGGRMASRAVGERRFDHGAQFFTAKGDDFRREVGAWVDAGVATTWFHGSPDAGRPAADRRDGHPRYRGAPHMRSVCEHLAGGLDVRCGERVSAIRVRDGDWHVGRTAVDGHDPAPLVAPRLVVTAPVPQALALLDAGRVDLPAPLRADLDRITYDPTLAVLAAADLDGTIGNGGALRLDGEPLAWVGDNHAKGVSARGAVTLHAGPRTSRLLDGEAPEEQARVVRAAAVELLGADVTPVRTHFWRYATPRPHDGEPYRLTTTPAPIALAGDAFAGGRVEGAFRSGRMAAAALLAR